MPIRPPANTNIPYVLSYTPYQINGQEAVTIADMVSVVIPGDLLSGSISYEVGSENAPSYTVSLTNRTSNAVLEYEISFARKALINSDAVVAGELATIKKTIPARQTVTVVLELNKEILDLSDNYDVYPMNFSVLVKNIANGSIVLKAG